MNARSMRAYVIRLVRQLKNEHCLPDRPSVPEVIKAMGLPKPVFGAPPQGQDGFRVDDQIVINPLVTCRERREFTGFHEITHILIERDGEVESQLLEYTHAESDGFHWTVEDLCQVGAAEFIMPSDKFAAYMEGKNWTVDAIHGAASVFSASTIATAFQFALRNPDPCTVLVAEPAGFTQADQPLLAGGDDSISSAPLTVTYCVHNDNSYPMCRNVLIPHDHVIAYVWRDGAVRTARARGWYKKGESYPMECYAARYGNRVVAAFYPRGKKWVSISGQGSLDLL